VCDLGLFKFVEYFNIFPTSNLRHRKGPAVPKTSTKDGRGETRLAKHSFKPTMTHVINFFAPLLVVRQKHVEGNTGCIGFPHLLVGSHICDGRNCELLNSMMTQICKRNRNWPSSKMQNVLGRTKPPKQKGVNLEGLEDEYSYD